VWLVVAVVLALVLRSGRRGVPVAIALYAVTIFPALGFANVFPMRYSFVADHFQYLASLGILVLVAAAVHRMLPSAALRWTTLGLVLVACAVLTQRQTGVWHDARTLYTETVRQNPAAWMAHANLASIELVEARKLTLAGQPRRAADRLRRAEAHARAGLAAGPSDPPLLVNLASALQARGRDDEAAAVMATATSGVREQIAHHRAAGNTERAAYSEEMLATYETLRGGFAEQAGNAAAAADAYQTALGLDADAIAARAGLARLAAARGDLETAAAHAATIVAANPADAGAHRLLARRAAEQGRWREAVEHLERARGNVAPGERASILVDLVWLRVSAPDPTVRADGAALAAARELVALRGEDDAATLDALAAALASERRFDEAVEVASRASERAAATKQDALRAAIAARLASYRAGAAPAE
jgi:tetratricopeptide (TPR) repeat protein